ncbi:MAG: cytochrome c biogenesis protein CcdA [Actinobacteria bacterium]|nr:cytochrome c biogenesis protein CcdA [Actinomycetota bacterium]
MPLALALVAGALASVNPCGFPLLPAFLSFYVGAEEDDLPRAPARVAQGLLVGLLVSAGFLVVFAVVGVPIAYGVTQLTSAIPWAGLAIGVVMVASALAGLAGRALYLSPRRAPQVQRRRRPTTMVWFGVAYAVCSLGCTLPIFVALVGASLATASVVEGVIVFGAYGLGMATMLMALSLGAALARDGLARRLKGLLPHMQRVASGLLLIAGAYLTYYWARVIWSPPESLGGDPLVGAMTRFATLVQRAAGSSGGRTAMLVAGGVVALGIGVAMWQWSGQDRSGPVHE